MAPWRVGPAHVERDLVQFVGGELRAAQDEPDLRPVPVADGHVPPVLDDRGDVAARLAQRRCTGRGRLCLASLISELPPIATTGSGSTSIVPPRLGAALR